MADKRNVLDTVTLRFTGDEDSEAGLHELRAADVAGHAGLDERFTPHSLRHFYASGLIHSGASPKVVSERLGHSSVDTTLSVYTKLWPGEDERTREAINALLVRDGSTVRDQRGTGSLGAVP